MKTPAKTVKTLSELVAEGLLAPDALARLEEVAGRYAIGVTPDMAALIDAGDASDPIGRQFLPTAAELQSTPDERLDPIGDSAHEKLPGLVHRYPDRVLLKVTHACPVYCRFCFRREMVGPGGPPPLSGAAFDAALDYISNRPEIFEVILTGGDPLVLSPRRIADITEGLASIPHVKALRWHSRVPVVDPGRVDSDLIAALDGNGPAVWLALHTNHPRELTDNARDAIERLQRSRIRLLSQTVLLKGVNDDAATLAELFRELVALGVKPYYLHHTDLAPGTGH
ncbi:MAG: lysine-2,3-aminomutase-like protein, partial [Proteobacteria bacterium]|nr:lysine-2,3-aminomutase-like protein [Pseudomonadota bacterium]